MAERGHKIRRQNHPPRTEAQIIYELGRRALQTNHRRKLDMELDQVVFEYGRLQLNFVACQRQNTLLGTQLAQLNKGNAAITKDLGKALARVAQLEALIGASGVLAIPAPPKDPEETKPISGDAPQNAADLANVQAQTGPRGSRLVSVPKATEPTPEN